MTPTPARTWNRAWKRFAERLLPHAWLVTPNAFELNRLTGMPALAEADAIAAARTLLDRGPHW